MSEEREFGLPEILSLLIAIIGLLLALALFSFELDQENLIGAGGYAAAYGLYFLFGQAATISGPYLILMGLGGLYRRSLPDIPLRLLALLSMLFCLAILAFLFLGASQNDFASGGGIFGRRAGHYLTVFLGSYGALILSGSGFLSGLLIGTTVRPVDFLRKLWSKLRQADWSGWALPAIGQRKEKKEKDAARDEGRSPGPAVRAVPKENEESNAMAEKDRVPLIHKTLAERRPWFGSEMESADEKSRAVEPDFLSTRARRISDLMEGLGEEKSAGRLAKPALAGFFSDDESHYHFRAPGPEEPRAVQKQYEDPAFKVRIVPAGEAAPGPAAERGFTSVAHSTENRGPQFRGMESMRLLDTARLRNRPTTAQLLYKSYDEPALAEALHPVSFSPRLRSEDHRADSGIPASGPPGEHDRITVASNDTNDIDEWIGRVLPEARRDPLPEDEPNLDRSFAETHEPEQREAESNVSYGPETFTNGDPQAGSAGQMADGQAIDSTTRTTPPFAGRNRTHEAEAEPLRIRPVRADSYYLPPELLDLPVPVSHYRIDEEIARTRSRLATVLKDFNIQAEMVAETRGPVLTRYEIKLDSGIKVSRIASLSDEIRMNLAATSVRIVAPIPGRSTIGIEIPNTERDEVTLGQMVRLDPEFFNPDRRLPIATGTDINGQNQYVDLSRLPHLLIAGATGAGKSVYMNSVIASLMYRRSPAELRFIMIDPKFVELSLYEGIPHLLMPVITDVGRAKTALAWAVEEMDRRYMHLASKKARDIISYNEKQPHDSMPYVVILIDELADLMMMAAREVEDSIIRLTQKARAVGIHVVMATQRPSVDVITALIKANCPARLAFHVAQRTDSRTILDMNGAETLLGRGDMLYKSPSATGLMRIQAPLISEAEIEKIVHEARKFGHPDYILLDEEKEQESDGYADSEDELELAWQIIRESGKTSISYLQRRMSIGYNRAAKLIEALEDKGYLSQALGTKPREILKRD